MSGGHQVQALDVGGLRDHLGRGITDFQIPNNERKISMLRNGREIN